jgi:hypothetical protein
VGKWKVEPERVAREKPDATWPTSAPCPAVAPDAGGIAIAPWRDWALSPPAPAGCPFDEQATSTTARPSVTREDLHLDVAGPLRAVFGTSIAISAISLLQSTVALTLRSSSAC